MPSAIMEYIALMLVKELSVESPVYVNAKVLTVPELVSDKVDGRIVLLKCPINRLFIEGNGIGLGFASPQSIYVFRTHRV